MEKSIPKPEVVPGTKPEVPSKETVKEWVRRDITASSYFLSLLLRYPDIIENIAEQLYERIMSEEQGAVIDHIKEKGDPNG